MNLTPADVQSMLISENLGDRLKGVNLLRQIDPKLAFTLIQPLVTDSNERVRYAAVSQLDTLGKQDLDITLQLLRDRLQNDTELDVKAAAADVIGGLQLTEAYDDLKDLYHQTTYWLLQLSIIATLGELGEPRALELLQEALKSDNDLVRISAVGALGELGNPEAVAILSPFVKDEDWQIRYRLVQALGRLGGEQAQTLLQELTQDPFEQVAKEAQDNLK
ncbi:phycobilisome degradation protein NblB [Crocosphaera sp. XPORK-15E]|uniref:phycobilisome degradation protein NblB n=1 Tax=Crocosphaera sp. XPORK-15E TaxID=3110247 RepID=UPI002B20034F|nr:HEAT repeat domain-containing protein [Crocosphaera sp. XPORK-15E]MEA5534631.1 HEAT repeat domain-containing protein [Crocosphaera sp. XPORK-15E]